MRIKKENGFTLIELCVVVAIIGIMAAIAVPNLLSWLPGIRLKAAARDLYSNMQKARMMAVKENRNISIRFDYTAGTPGFYYFDIDSSGTFTAGDVRVNLSMYKSGVAFGAGTANKNWNNVAIVQAPFITFSKTGTANSGSVFIQNQNNNNSYAVTSQVYGAVKLRKHTGPSTSW